MLLAVLARIPCHRWTHGEHIPVLGIPVTWAMVVWPGIMTISRSRYAKLGFDFYRFWWLSLPTVPPRFTGCSQKLRHTEVNMCYVLNISCNCCDVWNIVNAIVTPPTKSLWTLAPARNPWQASYWKADISRTKHPRLLKFCKILYQMVL